MIFTVGMVDDLREMSPPAKMSGQILAGTVLYLFGINMLFFRLPFAGTTVVLSADLIPVLTVLWVVGMANAVNLVDGLDGLAAGIVGIASVAFFLYSHQLVQRGTIGPESSGPLFSVIIFGLCLGFLPHNFHPARIFMGDAGAMLLGLLMAASTMSVVGQTNIDFNGRTYFFFAPLVIPFFILGIPMLDTAFAIVRRAGRRTNLAEADKNHLHHRLMRLGHGQTRVGADPVDLDGAALRPGALPEPRQPGHLLRAVCGSGAWSWPSTPCSGSGAGPMGAPRRRSQRRHRRQRARPGRARSVWRPRIRPGRGGLQADLGPAQGGFRLDVWRVAGV